MTTQKNVGWVRPEAVTHQNDKAGWRIATLGEFVATRSRGVVPNKTPGITFELYSVPSHDTGAPEIVKGGEIGSNKQIVDEGTVLLCKINPRINRSWVVSSHTVHQKIASTEWITFPPNTAVEPKYLAYYLKQDTVRDFLAANASGVGGSLMRVKPATLKDCPFPLAPLDHQKRIVAEIEKQFSRLDEAVANLKRVKVNLKRYKAAVLKAAVEGRLVETEAELARREGRSYETGEQLLQRILETRRSQWKGKGKYKEPAAPDTTDLPELPEGWVWASVSQIADVASGNTPAGILDIVKQTGDVPWFKVGGMNHEDNQQVMRHSDAWLSRTEVKQLGLRLFPAKTVLFPKRGGAIATNKKRRLESSGCADLNVMGITPGGQLASYFFVWFDGVDLGSLSDGSNVPQINHKDIEPLPLPVPPSVEQQRIAEEVDRRLSLLRETENQVVANFKRAERLRQSILKSAFSAELGVHNE